MFKASSAVALGVLLGASLVSAQSAGTGWGAYGNDAGSTKYSPLKQITPSNVTKLKIAWTYDTGETGVNTVPDDRARAIPA